MVSHEPLKNSCVSIKVKAFTRAHVKNYIMDFVKRELTNEFVGVKDIIEDRD